MILVIDNYDSFTYNLVQYVGSLGYEVIVRRNDKIALDEIKTMQPDRIIISPGPGYPDEAGISMQVIDAFKESMPILGVCLGHQCIGQVFGGEVFPAGELMHGKTSDITTDGRTIFKNIASPLQAGRYHSLIVHRESLPDCLEVSAETVDGLVMGLRHKTLPVEGVQFHPESILTPDGMRIIKNFLELDYTLSARPKKHEQLELI